MGNFIQHMGLWRADTHYVSNRDWDWQVFNNADPFAAAAWTASPAFYDSLFGNASRWGLVTAKHDHVNEQLSRTHTAMEELGYVGRVLDAELGGLRKHNLTMMGAGDVWPDFDFLGMRFLSAGFRQTTNKHSVHHGRFAPVSRRMRGGSCRSTSL